ncbi:hypothetical protein ACHAW5_010813 [Stephanodiscus triporus]|uniref:Uncharacterized protein n=1 Tax=Stephanodiscus triporus TaxID=2934178 RepID=A0ABD3NUH9_9STRA
MQPNHQVSINTRLVPMPPDARVPSSIKPISPASFYRPKRLDGGIASGPAKGDNCENVDKGKQANLCETKPQTADEYSFNGGGAELGAKTPVVGNRSKEDTNHVNGDGERIGVDQPQKAMNHAIIELPTANPLSHKKSADMLLLHRPQEATHTDKVINPGSCASAHNLYAKITAPLQPSTEVVDSRGGDAFSLRRPTNSIKSDRLNPNSCASGQKNELNGGVSRLEKLLDGGIASGPAKGDNCENVDKGKQANLCETKPQTADEYSINGDGAVLLSPERHSIDAKTPVVGNTSKEDTNHVNDDGERIGVDQPQKAMKGEKNELHGGVSRLRKNRSLEKSLHELLHDDFQSELVSLRESTIEALQLSHQERERLCLDGEILEARIANIRHKIGLTRDQLQKRGVVLEEESDDLRLSLVQEGEEGMCLSGHTLDVGVDKEPVTSPTKDGLSSLQPEGCTMSDCSGMPHLSRTSFFGMGGASKSWIDKSENSRGSALNIRISFMDGAGDGMPSRWRAREQERAKKAKQNEKEEYQSKRKAICDEKIGHDVNSTSRRAKDKSKEEKVQDLIFKREKEISVLEKRALSLEQETQSMRDEVSILRKDLEHVQGKFQQEKTQLLIEIDRVELDNGKLDHVCLCEGILLEERKLVIEIIANELKEAREELAQIQNENDRRKSEQKTRRWNKWKNRLSDASAGGASVASASGDIDRQSFQRRRSSQMSSLTIDSMNYVDILEQV